MLHDQLAAPLGASLRRMALCRGAWICVAWICAAALGAGGSSLRAKENAPVTLPGPASELRAALADLEALPPQVDRQCIRYVSHYPLPAERWAAATAAVAFVLNSVSRSELLWAPQPTEGGGGRLLRIDWSAYDLPPELWERLAQDDPYWHLQTDVLPPQEARARQQADRPERVFTDGGWVDLAAAATLRELTGSAGALLRSDYFLTRASTTLDGGLYYELAGVPATRREFYESLGLDVATIRRLGADDGANLLRSEVTFKLRRVIRRQGPLGGSWVTLDVASSTPERDPFRNPLNFEFDASEHIAARANGLHVYALFDRAGDRQATVPDAIAKDSSDPHGSGIIAPLLSCVRCHVEDGLRPLVNDQRRLMQGGLELLTDDAAAARRLAGFYLGDLEKRLRRDREDFASATQAATGQDVAFVSAALAELYADYHDRAVRLEDAAREVGVTEAALAQACQASTDPVLLALVAGLAVQRQQWESAFAEAAVRCATSVEHP